MGRVARYKKIKSFDPYSKQNRGRVDLATVGIWGLSDSGRKLKKRSKTSEKLRAQKKKRKRGGVNDDGDGFDAPVQSGDDFDLSDLVGSLRKQKPQAAIILDKPIIPQSAAKSASGTHGVNVDDESDKREAKLLKLEDQVSEGASRQAAAGRKEGESKRAYDRRFKAETRQIIKEEQHRTFNHEKKQRKKEFLNNKKKKGKGKRRSIGSKANEDNLSSTEIDRRDNGALVTAEKALDARARETVRFGEQAERPPCFRQLPRGATKKETGRKSSGRLKNDEDITAEQEAMELIRRKTLAQYAAIKMKRRQDGDFHL